MAKLKWPKTCIKTTGQEKDGEEKTLGVLYLKRQLFIEIQRYPCIINSKLLLEIPTTINLLTMLSAPGLKMGIYDVIKILFYSKPEDLPEHGVTVVFVALENTKIELLFPLGTKSPIEGFLAKNSNGGIHHVCIEVDDIQAAVK